MGTIINWFSNDTIPELQNKRGQLNVNNNEHNKFIYTDPFHRMNVRRNMEPTNDNNRDKYAFEPIVNNNMLWSTSTRSDNLNFVTPNTVSDTLPNLPSDDPSSDPDLSADNPVDDTQSYFIEKYCALLSFPHTHPSNNINYGGDWYSEVSLLDPAAKQKIIQDTK